MLKAENLQRTGSFKVRGVAAKLAALGDGCARGVVAASRRQPRARRSPPRPRARGVPCEVFVPADAPMAKVEARARRRAPSSTSAATASTSA